MARRRALTGRPILVASGLVLSVGCGGGRGPREPEPVGNLMAPAPVEAKLCVDVVPAEAHAVVSVEGQVVTDRCFPVHPNAAGQVHLEVSATDFDGSVLDLPYSPQMEPVKVELQPMVPVGNLMVPPQPEKPGKRLEKP